MIRHLLVRLVKIERKWISPEEPLVKDVVDVFPCLSHPAHVRTSTALFHVNTLPIYIYIYYIMFVIYRYSGEFKQIIKVEHRTTLL